jgi:hypothetical protein
MEEAVGPCSYAPREMQPMDVDRLWETFATITPING